MGKVLVKRNSESIVFVIHWWSHKHYLDIVYHCLGVGAKGEVP